MLARLQQPVRPTAILIMPTSSKPRKKYRPKPLLHNPMEYAKGNVSTLGSYHSRFLLDLKIKNSSAMASLMQGSAVPHDIHTLLGMCNMVEQLWLLGFGAEYADVWSEGRQAILSIIDRHEKRSKYVPTGEEIKRLNLLMELHDAQMEVITVRDMEKAINQAKKRLRKKGI